jgi:hypothetical protein
VAGNQSAYYTKKRVNYQDYYENGNDYYCLANGQTSSRLKAQSSKGPQISQIYADYKNKFGKVSHRLTQTHTNN